MSERPDTAHDGVAIDVADDGWWNVVADGSDCWREMTLVNANRRRLRSPE